MIGSVRLDRVVLVNDDAAERGRQQERGRPSSHRSIATRMVFFVPAPVAPSAAVCG